MTLRNLSAHEMFKSIVKTHHPKHHFADNPAQDFVAWKEKTRPAVHACLGDWPERCKLNPQLTAEWKHDGLIKQRWLIDVHPHLSAFLLLNYPENLDLTTKHPAILCWHGHGYRGKEPVMGNNSSAALQKEIEVYNYNYGHQMAQKGFITYAIDWMGYGDHNEALKPNYNSVAGNRDWCNLYYLHATMLGMTSLSINITHGMAATDFACSLPFVDESKLGVMGLSGGGTMTTWTYFCDQRFKAAEIICYSDLWEHFGINCINYCGMQVAPGLYKLVDLPDLQGLLAPMPLLIDIGANDTCFVVDSALACYRQVEKIYTAANAGEKLELDLHSGNHAWGSNKSEEFFKKYL